MKTSGIFGGSIVDTTEGSKKIKELIGRDDVWLLCRDFKNGANIFRKAYDIHLNGKKYPTMEIELTDNSKFKISTNEEFYLKSEKLVKAKNIKSSNMIFGFKYHHRVKKVNNGSLENIYNLTIPNIHNFFIFNINYIGDSTGILISSN